MPKKNKSNKHIIVDIFLVITFLLSVAYFVGNIIIDKDINELINSFILVLFTLFYVVYSIKFKAKSKSIVFMSSLLLIAFYTFNILNTNNIISIKNTRMINLSGKSIDYVVNWSVKNNIKLEEEYEYSDMVKENFVITQSVREGEALKDIDTLKIAISDGPSPSKEIVIPDMSGWKKEEVISFVEENFLGNVDIKFKSSKSKEGTVIEQSRKGTMKRSDNIKITFSYGEELDFESVSLRELVGMSKFRAKFYLEEHHVKYKFKDDYSDKYKKGIVMKQSEKPGTEIKIDDKEITVTVSRGKKIKVIELKGKSIKEVTKWIIKNHLKVEFEEKYDDKIKKNTVIGSDKKKGDIVTSGDTIKVYVSLGKLRMKHFKDLAEFYEWANKHNVKYEEEHEFSDKVAVGEIIKFSVKEGEVIKSGDVIKVIISNGNQIKMPDVVGLSREKAISILKDNNIKYSIVYRSSSEVSEGKVISQSIRSGSKISENTTVTITVSKGKNVEERRDTNNKPSSNSSNSGNNNHSSGGGSSTPTPTCNSCSFRPAEIYSVLEQYNNCNSAASALRSSLTRKCSGLKVNVTCKKADGYDSADFISGFDGGTVSSCDTVSIVLAS
ncbi:MAG: PASTA domain-containing protein [Bacilli bacterium]|nr:PASTA domain-containing protein [Bacilli bacterium]